MTVAGLALSNASYGQHAVACDVLRFQNGESAFLEVHVDFESSLFKPVWTEEGWQTNVQIEAVVESANGIVNYGKTNILGPVASDSVEATTGRQFHLERIPVPSGTYNVAVTLRDMVGADGFEETTRIPVEFVSTDVPFFSDPFVVEAFSPSAGEPLTMLSRSGYEMLPVVEAQLSTEALPASL